VKKLRWGDNMEDGIKMDIGTLLNIDEAHFVEASGDTFHIKRHELDISDTINLPEGFLVVTHLMEGFANPFFVIIHNHTGQYSIVEYIKNEKGYFFSSQYIPDEEYEKAVEVLSYMVEGIAAYLDQEEDNE
jgi:hypothetical protein